MAHRWLMKQAALLSLAVLVGAAAALAQNVLERARTQSGRDVVLRSDGTWAYADKPAGPPQVTQPGSARAAVRDGGSSGTQPPGGAGGVQRPADAKTALELRRGGFRFWYNPAKWRPSPANADGRVQLQLVGHEAYIVLIPEGTPLPIPQLKTVALENAKQSGPDARIALEQPRTLGGRDVLLMQIDVTLGATPVAFLGYYYGDPRGSIQAVGYTSQRDLPRYRAAILDGLAGLDLNR